MRQQQRALKRTNRDLERDRHSLERQEKQLVSSLHACDSHVIHVTSVLVLLSGFHHAMCTSTNHFSTGGRNQKGSKARRQAGKTTSWLSQFERLQVKVGMVEIFLCTNQSVFKSYFDPHLPFSPDDAQ